MELVVLGLSEEGVPLLVWDSRFSMGFTCLLGRGPGSQASSRLAGIVSLADHGLSPFLQAGLILVVVSAVKKKCSPEKAFMLEDDARRNGSSFSTS